MLFLVWSEGTQLNNKTLPCYRTSNLCVLTFLHGPGYGSTQGHVARVRDSIKGHLTLLSFFLWPKGEVHGVYHKHPVQSL